MENYQLYRTNVLLSGQMQWDLILNGVNKKLFIDDFHLTPISENISFDKKNNEVLLNYSHQENIKTFYNKLKDYFYDSAEPQLFTNNWPAITDKPINSYCDMFNMGCKRSQSYQLYNKQFEFLCPVWIECIKNNQLAFVFNIKNKYQRLLSSAILKFDISNNKFHDKFVKYFNDYMNHIGLDEGDDRLIEIDLNKNQSKITGVEVTSGNNSQKYLLNLNKNLLSRERPLMETDNYIINSYKENNMISKQLINFNFCFNLNDLITDNINSMLIGGNFSVEVYAGTFNDDKFMPFKLVDFYSNYDFIPKRECGYVDNLHSDYKLNVLDYMSDYKSIDLMDKNKFIQNILHWSIQDNNNYIFNLYDGFSGYSKSNDQVVEYTHMYDNTPNIYQEEYSKSLNNINWANTIYVNNTNKFRNIIYYINEYMNKYSSDFSNKWVNNIKYDYNDNIKVLLLYTDSLDVIYNSYEAGWHTLIEDDYKYLKYTVDDNSILFLTNNLNYITFKNIKPVLKAHREVDSIQMLYNILNSFNEIPIIYLNNSLSISKVNGPIPQTNEIEYYKAYNTTPNYLYRYDGNIKPTFLFLDGSDINFNKLYYKDYLSDNRTEGLSDLQKSIYSQYSKTGYMPLYKSINYFSIKDINLTDYKHVPFVKVTGINGKTNFSLLPIYEYKWFENSNIIYLKENINTILYSEKQNGEYVKIEILIKKYLKELYNITENELVDYIYDKYHIDSNFDYKEKDNIDEYKYNIKLTLK